MTGARKQGPCPWLEVLIKSLADLGAEGLLTA